MSNFRIFCVGFAACAFVGSFMSGVTGHDPMYWVYALGLGVYGGVLSGALFGDRK